MSNAIPSNKGVSFPEFHQMLFKFSAEKVKNRSQLAPCPSRSSSADFGSNQMQGVPPVEKFLGIPESVRRQKFFQSVRVGDIVKGKVTECSASGLTVTLLKILTGKRRLVKDLNIKCLCPVYEIEDSPKHTGDPLESFEVGDLVKAAVGLVNPKLQTIELTLRRKKEHLRSRIALGIVVSGSETDDGSVKEEPGNGRGDNYLDYLHVSQSFIDPASCDDLCKRLGISTRQSSFLKSEKGYIFPPEEHADRLKERQSHKWSMDMVATGVRMFKEDKNSEALKCFNQALNLCPKNVEALVARGALKANQGNLKDSIADFRSALEISPTHKNGRKYLAETLSSLGQRYEKDRKWKEASSCYKEVVELNPSYEDTVRRLRDINELIKKQTAASEKKLKAPVKLENSAVKSETKSDKTVHYLKRLLDGETKATNSKKSKKLKRSRKKRKGKSKKKRKRKYSSSSESDTEATDSASDGRGSSHTDSGDEWIEKPAVKQDRSAVESTSVHGMLQPSPGHEKKRHRVRRAMVEQQKEIGEEEPKSSSSGTTRPQSSDQRDKSLMSQSSASHNPSLVQKLRHFSEDEIGIVARLLKTDPKR